MSGTGSITTLVVVAALAAAALAPPCLRTAGREERIAVHRRGRPTRVRGPGLVFLLPGVHRAVRVSLPPARLDPLTVSGKTADGLSVAVLTHAVFRVTDPALVPPDVAGRTAAAVEAATAARVGELPLVDLLTERVAVAAAWRSRTSAHTRQWGVEVIEIGPPQVEVRLDEALLRWADQRRRS